MERILKTIDLDEEFVNLLEAYDHEYTSRKDVIAYMISNDMGTSNETFKQYQKEMIEFNVKFNAMKDVIQEQYIKPLQDSGEKPSRWQVDYKNKILNIFA